jgi:hypothetical protein
MKKFLFVFLALVFPLAAQTVDVDDPAFLASLSSTIAGSVPTNGLSLWLEADSGVILSGGNVTQWDDQSGNGYTATNSGNVTYTSSGINSKPAFTFSNGFLYGTGGSFGLLTTFSLCMVVVPDHPTFDSNGIMFGVPSDSPASVDHGWTSSIYNLSPPAVAMITAFSGNTLSQGNQDLVYGTPTLIESTYDVGASPKWTLYKNSVSDGASGLSTAIVVTADNTFYIGKGPSGYQYGGMIAAIFFYNRVLTSEERQSLETYCNSKYAIY